MEDSMRKLALVVASVLFALPALAATENFKDVALVDAKCAPKVAGDPDSHPRVCALQCAASGFVVITADKKVLKLDANGNAKVTEALKNSTKKDHLRVNVSGDVQGDTLNVQSLTLL
jgi:alpha-tubulin suppressor-like RCC1 family protein